MFEGKSQRKLDFSKKLIDKLSNTDFPNKVNQAPPIPQIAQKSSYPETPIQVLT